MALDPGCVTLMEVNGAGWEGGEWGMDVFVLLLFSFIFSRSFLSLFFSLSLSLS